MTDRPVDGFLVVDKPSGPTSHDVVARVRRAAGIKKVGHAGTLDPMATGVVVVALGRATRLIRFVQDLPKEYVATARFGESTDTLDADGSVVDRRPMEVGLEEVRGVVPRFTGSIMQVPPMVSALKVGGRRLYDLAREGKEVERAPRMVQVHEIEILEVGPPPYPEVTLRVRCGKGTYIRSLAADMAAALGGGAHLIALRRTAVGHLGLSQAVAMDELPDQWSASLLPPLEGLAGMPRVQVPRDLVVAVGNGRPLPPVDGIEDGAFVAVTDPSGGLLAVYRQAGTAARPEVVVA